MQLDPSWAKLVRTSAAMDTVENLMPRDLRKEERLTCTFSILGGPELGQLVRTSSGGECSRRLL
jgi:hypothetical protein